MRIVYLKVNRFSDYLIPSVKNSVAILQLLPDTKIFFICDNMGVRKWIEDEVDLSKLDFEWIPSQRDDPDMKLFIDKVTAPNWHNAGFAHMTTFWHARENHFENFWNMDADDFRFFDPPEKTAKMFTEVERFADEKKIKIFSMDLWPTISYGKHWTFGITYTDNRFPWFDTLKKIVTNDICMHNYAAFIQGGQNVDWFFTFLRFMNYVSGIESFYVENLRFAHHLHDIFLMHCAGVRYCTNGRYHISFFENEFGLGESGSIPIDRDVYKIDIGLTAQDSYDYFYNNYQGQGLLDSFKTINRVAKISEADLKFSVLIDLKQDTDLNPILGMLRKQESNFKLVFLDVPKFLVARGAIRCNHLFFPGGIRIIPKSEFKPQMLKTRVFIVVNGTEDQKIIDQDFSKAYEHIK